MPRFYGVMNDYDYSETHKRERITVWTGAFMGGFVCEGYSLPKKNGYMLSFWGGDKVRVSCPVPRDESTYEEIDRAINVALNNYYKED